MVLRHRKCFGGCWVLIGSLEGVSGTPSNPMGHMGLVKEHTSPQGAGAPYKSIGGGEGKGEGKGKCGLGFPLPSTSCIHGKGGKARQGP